jgi:hypothetical protein
MHTISVLGVNFNFLHLREPTRNWRTIYFTSAPIQRPKRRNKPTVKTLEKDLNTLLISQIVDPKVRKKRKSHIL